MLTNSATLVASTETKLTFSGAAKAYRFVRVSRTTAATTVFVSSDPDVDLDASRDNTPAIDDAEPARVFPLRYSDQDGDDVIISLYSSGTPLVRVELWETDPRQPVRQ
jgi:hypothetical protein